MRTRTPVASVFATVATVAVAGLLVGCGGGNGGTGVATLGGDAEPRNGAADQDPETAFRKFAACMREHGIDMPDPEISGDGDFVFSAPGANSIDGAPVLPGEDFAAANEACERHLEGVVRDAPAPDPEELEQIRRQALEFARCMREEGIDFPDPEFGGDGGGETVLIAPGEAVDPTDPVFALANERCAEEAGLPQPGAGGAQPGTRIDGSTR